MADRDYSPLDRCLINLDQALRAVFGTPFASGRAHPAAGVQEPELSAAERELSARLMRVNHAGEVCAQALYQGQALGARSPEVHAGLERAANEENDHLAWCAERVHALGSHTSLLNPAWYAGSFAIGVLAALAGAKWSLGFVAETEHQVVRHLQGHLQRLPGADAKSRAILEQMKTDEARHATVALEAGGAELPGPVKKLMALASRVMTRTAYWM